MPKELPIHYDFEHAHETIYPEWRASGALDATPDDRSDRYVIMMPLPNVTGALHMGHAMDNVMQDLLIRFNRMQGKNTLWMPGCDHAGIATQAVVEKRLLELEGKTRNDLGREQLVDRIWKWKDEYQARIIEQQQRMGCSCAWDLHRFTMDAVCARAVREAFFRMFRDGLIFRGNRMVNWDCHLQTAVSDDEIVRESVQGSFWHLKYPVIDPKPGEPEFVVVATTRPETMLGDTAVAVHPDPSLALQTGIKAARKRLSSAPARERAEIETEIARLEARVDSHLELLETLRAMAVDGRRVLLPLTERDIPIILDEWAKPELGSGCVKVTPAHDPNDYEVWKRHSEEIGIINLLEPDGTYNENAGVYAGLDRDEVRNRVISDLDARALLLEVEDREIELGFSDRSKTPIEPYVSRQWFVRMSDVEGKIRCGRGTPNEFLADGLAQIAIDAVDDSWCSPTGRKLEFHPDPQRYRTTFINWLSEKRDWCISRQLWWGHRIPIWHGDVTTANLATVRELARRHPDDLWAWLADDSGAVRGLDSFDDRPAFEAGEAEAGKRSLLVCIRSEDKQPGLEARLIAVGLERDPDVLDTWFSSALWPFSTLGWPDPSTADVGEDHRALVSADADASHLDYYYPGSCLVTARDIITLWVARMTILGLYLLGDVPFTDCFIHANIQDGKGERMSKSKGNGIDPIDIITEYGADAMRYVICDMQTGTQDIKLPAQAISPYTGNLVDLATAKHGRTIFTYLDPENGKEFDVLGSIEDLPRARITSLRFDAGKAFCTKLWNAARFAFMNLETSAGAGETDAVATVPLRLAPEDQWILSRLAATVREVTTALEGYSPSAALGAAREFFWSDLCDWYLEIIKPRIANSGRSVEAGSGAAESIEAKGLRTESARVARRTLAYVVDRVLRLFHPFVPYITETLWKELNARMPVRGINRLIEAEALLIRAQWPEAECEFESSEREAEFALVQEFVRAVRDLRARYNIALSVAIAAKVKASGIAADRLNAYRGLIAHLVNIDQFEIGETIEKPPLSATTVVGSCEVYLEGLVDIEKEREKLGKQRERLSQGVNQLKKKLSNSGFVEKAPAEVVERERTRVAELERELLIVERSLLELSEAH